MSALGRPPFLASTQHSQMTDVGLLDHLNLPSEIVHEIRQYVGPHPCAVMIRDRCEGIEFIGQEAASLIQYMERYRLWETKLRLRCLHETMMRLLDHHPNGTYILTSPPPAPWVTSLSSTYVARADVSGV